MREKLAWGRRSGRREDEERPQKRAWANRGDRCLCLFLSVFAVIEGVIYLSKNYEDIIFLNYNGVLVNFYGTRRKFISRIFLICVPFFCG